MIKQFLFCFFAAFVTSVSGEIALKSYLVGKFDPKEDSLFVQVPQAYSGKAETQYLRREAMTSFIGMAEAAKKEGISLLIVSATRTYSAQKAIWEAKWNGTREEWRHVTTKYPGAKERALAILQYSSMPGTSRHHWGTDVDINSVDPAYFRGASGKQEYDWLVKHAESFGFCRPYTPKGKERPTGYSEEPWHWSYLPLARDFLRKYPTLITYSDLKGFDGDQTAEPLQVIHTYVLGVHPSCK